MNPGQLIALGQVALSTACTIGYGVAGDIRHALYWAFAAGITLAVTL